MNHTPPSPTSQVYTDLSNSLLRTVLNLNTYALHLANVIQVGPFGVIFLADQLLHDHNAPGRYRRTRRQFAVKCLVRSPRDPHHDKFVLRERDLHSVLQQHHPNLAKLHAVVECMDPSRSLDLVYLVMDYYPEGDLFKAIVDRVEYVGDDDRVRDSFLQVARAVRACHRRGVAHRDIKPENVLFRSGGNAYPTLALADFGLATPDAYSSEYGVGSSYYMSPECTDGDNVLQMSRIPYDTRANDVWSLGILLVNLACGRNPWCRAHPEDPSYLGYLTNPDFLLTILPISYELNDLLKRVLTTSGRIGIDELIYRVERMEKFTLIWTELCTAGEGVKSAAGERLWEVRLWQAREKDRAEVEMMLRPTLDAEYGATLEALHASEVDPTPYDEEAYEDLHAELIPSNQFEDGDEEEEEDEDDEELLEWVETPCAGGGASTPSSPTPTCSSPSHDQQQPAIASSPSQSYIDSLFAFPAWEVEEDTKRYRTAVSDERSHHAQLPSLLVSSPGLTDDCESDPSTPGAPRTPGTPFAQPHHLYPAANAGMTTLFDVLNHGHYDVGAMVAKAGEYQRQHQHAEEEYAGRDRCLSHDLQDCSF